MPALMASESPLAQDPRYPLREYEFVELFVRCAVRSHLNEAIARGSKGSFGETMDVVDENGQMSTVARTQLSGMPGHNSTMSNLRTGTVKPRNGTDLAEIVYSALAEKVITTVCHALPLALFAHVLIVISYCQLHAVTSDWNLIPALAGDIYSSSVQQLFTKHATTAKQIFDSLKSDLTPPSLRTVLSYVLSLKAPTADFATPVIAADCGLLKLLDIVAASLVHSDPSVTLSNMTKLDNRFMLEDFLELLCKLVLSEVWVHGSVKQPVIEDAEPTSIDGGADGAAVDELALTTSDIKIVTPSQTIIEKLTLWFEDYRKPVEGTVPDV